LLDFLFDLLSLASPTVTVGSCVSNPFVYRPLRFEKIIKTYLVDNSQTLVLAKKRLKAFTKRGKNLWILLPCQGLFLLFWDAFRHFSI